MKTKEFETAGTPKRQGRKLILLVALLISLSSFTSSYDPARIYRSFLNEEGSGWRIHFRGDGTVRALYGQGRSTTAKAEETALRFLEKFHEMFGVQTISDWKLVSREETKLGMHFTYKQFHSNIQVEGSSIRLSVNKSNAVVAVNARSHKVTNTNFKISEVELAAQTIQALFKNGGEVGIEGLTFIEQRPAWKATFDSHNLADGSWLLWIDAANPNVVLRAVKTYMSAEGQTNIWKESPATTPQRSRETLLNMDASTGLSGKFARMYDANFFFDVASPIKTSDYTRAKERSRIYDYPEGDARLTEAMGYHHIDRAHERWQSFGLKGLTKAPIFVNVAASDGGPGYDNAHYARNQKFKRTGVYVFGAGDRFENAGLDSEVYYHEYGHGVLDKVRPEFLESVESAYPWAFHEAFGDISASAITGDSKLFEFSFRLKGSNKFNGRKMKNKKKFPKNVIWPPAGIAEPHYTCLILNGAWWDLQSKIGILEAQELVYESLRLMPDDMTFFDFRDAMLAADQAIHSGTNAGAIQTAFARHGLGGSNPGQPGTLSVSGIVTARDGTTGYTLTSQFSPTQTVWVIVEYAASGLLPGFNLVAHDLQFETPAGSNARILPLIPEVANGSHLGLDGLFFLEIPTDSNTARGTYTIRITPRLGGSSNVLETKSVTFTIQ
jgi:hypothetical protein